MESGYTGEGHTSLYILYFPVSLKHFHEKK